MKKSTNFRFTVVTYNIHCCIGFDRRRSTKRIVRVINEMDADVIGLQEVDTFHATSHIGTPLDDLAKHAGYHVLMGPTMDRGSGCYGNALLTRWDIAEYRPVDLSFGGREPRGAIDAMLDIRNIRVRFIVTHLGLKSRERIFQVKTLLDLLRSDRSPHLILMGDINEWLPGGRILRTFQESFGTSPAIPTYPSRLPILALDRIWLRHGMALFSISAHRSPLSRLASDHLPLKAVVGFS